MTAVDVHCHIYPEKIAEKAVEAVGGFYDIPMRGRGSVEHLYEVAKGSAITHFVVHSVAVKSSNVESINNFILRSCEEHDDLIGFAAMHQDFENPREELERVKAAGLVGIKIHPDFQKVNIDDLRLMRVYEIAEELGMPVILHTGDFRTDFSHPRRVKTVLRAFPQLRIDAAHFGGWSMPDVAYDCLCDENCFIDVSSSFFMIGKRHARELIELYGFERVLFGSDFPMWKTADEFETFMSLDFSAEAYEQMLHTNAERFLGTKIG